MSCFRCLWHLELFLYHGNRAPTRSFWNSTSEAVSVFPTRPEGLVLATGSSAAMSQRFVRLRALCARRFRRWNASVIPRPDLTRDQSEGHAPHLRVRKYRLGWHKGIFFFRHHVPSQIIRDIWHLSPLPRQVRGEIYVAFNTITLCFASSASLRHLHNAPAWTSFTMSHPADPKLPRSVLHRLFLVASH